MIKICKTYWNILKSIFSRLKILNKFKFQVYKVPAEHRVPDIYSISHFCHVYGFLIPTQTSSQGKSIMPNLALITAKASNSGSTVTLTRQTIAAHIHCPYMVTFALHAATIHVTKTFLSTDTLLLYIQTSKDTHRLPYITYTGIYTQKEQFHNNIYLKSIPFFQFRSSILNLQLHDQLGSNIIS